MKNQNDLIFSIAFAVVGLGATAAFFFTKPQANSPAAPTTVTVTPVTLPTVAPVMADSLGGGSTGNRSGMGSGFGGPMGFGGPPGMGGGMAGPGGGPTGSQKRRPGPATATNG